MRVRNFIKCSTLILSNAPSNFSLSCWELFFIIFLLMNTSMQSFVSMKVKPLQNIDILPKRNKMIIFNLGTQMK